MANSGSCRSSRVRFFLLLALVPIVVTLVVSIWDIVFRGDLRRHVVRVVFSPDGETLGAAVFSGRSDQLYDPTQS